MLTRVSPNKGTSLTFNDYLVTRSTDPVQPTYLRSGDRKRIIQETMLMAENRNLRETQKVFGSTGVVISDSFKNMLPLILVFILLTLVIFKR